MNKKSIIIGTELFSGSWGEKFNKKKIDEIFYYSLSRGINEIDTAPSYGKNNKVEKLIGDCIKGSRKKFIISSKFSNKIIGTGPTQSKKRIDLVKRSLDKSLSSLKTDFIDNFFFHSGTNQEFFHDDMWKFLNEMKSKKVIRRLGLSIKHNLVKKNSNHQLKSAKYYGISIISTVLNLFSKEALKFAYNSNLENLWCNENQIASLDISNNPLLNELDCGGNQITTLDVSENTDLTLLDCGGDQITILDVSHNTVLTSLECAGNQLTSLDVSNNIALTYLK